ncbi:uncharacterized protein [Ptychodera flava]
MTVRTIHPHIPSHYVQGLEAKKGWKGSRHHGVEPPGERGLNDTYLPCQREKTPSNTNTETTSTTTTSTTTTTSRPRRSLYAPTESSLAKISSALHTESTNSPRTRRLKSQTSLELTSPENEDNSYPTKAFKEAEDKLTMPPPASTSVAKTKATSRRSLSDPRSRNYSKARRFPPNSPTKDASRSLTINDPTTIAMFVEGSRKKDSSTATLQPSIDEEDQQIAKESESVDSKVEDKVESQSVKLNTAVKSNVMADAESTDEKSTVSAALNGHSPDAAVLSIDSVGFKQGYMERRLTFDLPLRANVIEPPTTTTAQQYKSDSSPEVSPKENQDVKTELANVLSTRHEEQDSKDATSHKSDAVEQKAEQSMPVEKKAEESKPVEQKADQSRPVEQKADQSRPVEQKADQSRPVEQKADQSRPVEQKIDSQIAGSPNAPNIEGATALTFEECTKTANELHTAFTKAIQLHTDVIGQSNCEEEKQKMLSVLSSTFKSMQETLTNIEQPTAIITERRKSSLDAFSSADLGQLTSSMAQTTSASNNNPPNAEASSALSLLDHYSDMLVTLVKNKMTQEETNAS